MADKTEILMAGFGGQGIQFAAKMVANCGLAAEKTVTVFPSYGPEARGGTSSCSVIVSDSEIGSPIVSEPDILMVLTLLAFNKFISKVKSGGMLFVDSSLIFKKTERDDIKIYEVPATAMALDNNLVGSANVIMLGKFIAETKLFSREEFLATMAAEVPDSRAAMREKNAKAFDLGFEF